MKTDIPGMVAGMGTQLTFMDNNATGTGTIYYYQVVANNVVGDTDTYTAPAAGYPSVDAPSAPASINATAQ